MYWDHPKTLDGKLRHGSQDGLALRITQNGRKSFLHSFHFNGKRQRRVIGKPDTMTVDAARLMVQNRNAKIEDGESPDEEVTDARKKHFVTFGELAEQYLEERLADVTPKYRWEFCRLVASWLSQPENSQNSRGKNIRRKIKSFGDYHRDHAAESITPQNVNTFLRKFESDHIANAALMHLKALYNWAIRMQILDMRNPCMPIDKRKIYKQRREFSVDDIAALAGHIFNPPVEALCALPENTPKERQVAALKRRHVAQQNEQMLELCHYLGVLFLTMARPKEVSHAKFEHFDLDRLVWHKHNTKGLKLSKAQYEYESRSVPIHPRVAEIVRRQKERWPEADFVFPSHTDLEKPRDNFKTVMKQFKKLDGVPEHFQMYDIKRMAISMLISGKDVRRDALSHYVDHKGNIETTLIYDLGFVDPMRPVADKLGELLGV